MFKTFLDSENNKTFYKYKNLKNGQVACILFGRVSDNWIGYTTGFVIGKNRKELMDWFQGNNRHFDSVSTGKGGLEGLIWAKDQLLEFETFIRPRHLGDLYIICEGSDKKRKSVYEKVLKRYGYDYDKRGFMFKKIE